MTGVRLFHIKSFLGDNVYITRGVNTPHPRAGDLEILLSYSGETRPVIIWADVIKKFAGTVFAITSNKDSTLSKKADLSIILPEEAKPQTPRRFYTRAAYVLSPLPVKLAERLGQRGLNLPEYIISWYQLRNTINKNQLIFLFPKSKNIFYFLIQPEWFSSKKISQKSGALFVFHIHLGYFSINEHLQIFLD